MKIVYHPFADDEFLDAAHSGFWLSTITAVTRIVGSTGSANDVRHYLVVARSWAPSGPPPSMAKSCADGGSGAQLRCAVLRPTRPCHGEGPSGADRFGGYTGNEPPYVDTSASETCRGPEKTRRPEGAGLCRVAGNRAAGAVEEHLWLCLIEGRRGEGLQCEGLLEAFSLGSDLLLVDGTSRLCRQGKANRQHSRLDGLRPGDEFFFGPSIAPEPDRAWTFTIAVRIRESSAHTKPSVIRNMQEDEYGTLRWRSIWTSLSPESSMPSQYR
jgi:hypothetical protein